MRPFQFAPLLSLVSLASAWPWPPSFDPSLNNIEHLLKRQNNGNGATQAQPGSASNGGTPQTTAGTPAATGKNTASITNSGSQPTGTGAFTFNGNMSTTVFDPRDPAGGVSMISPNPISGAQYYKVGDWIHFAWNYTSLQATPTAINVAASCSANNQVYTLVSNQTIQPTGEIFWDTGSYQQTAINSLLTNTYTLIIWDASKPMSATPSAGYLGSYNQFTFGMYIPQPYQNLSSFQCPTCNGAASLERMTLKFLLGMAAMTVFSFTWFATNLSLL